MKTSLRILSPEEQTGFTNLFTVLPNPPDLCVAVNQIQQRLDAQLFDVEYKQSAAREVRQAQSIPAFNSSP